MNAHVNAYVQRLMEAKDLTPHQLSDRVDRILRFQQAFHDLEASLGAERGDEDAALRQTAEQDGIEHEDLKQRAAEKNENEGGDTTMTEEEAMVHKLKVEFKTTHQQLMALFGYEHINRLPGHLYDGLPVNTMDKEEYQRRMNGAEQELLSAAQVRDAEIARASTLSSVFDDKERIKRYAEKKYSDTVARIKSGLHHFLHTVKPIDACAFNAKRQELLDKKMAALRELRMLQIKGVDIGELL